MRLDEFTIGKEFHCGLGRFLCTDKGTRTVTAINVTGAPDPSWLKGPPYALNEIVFDEEDQKGCTEAKPNA